MKRQHDATIRLLYSASLIGLGILTFVYRDFALQWQPVAGWLPARFVFVVLSGALLLGTGIGLLIPACRKWSIRILFPYLLLWLFLKVPAVFAAPTVEGAWLGLAEIAVLFSAGWLLLARTMATKARPTMSRPPALWRQFNNIQAARYLFALALLPIGLSHLVYLPQTVALVPAWLPLPTSLALFTGIAQIACGACILSSFVPRIAANIEAVLMSLFTLLVWAPTLFTTADLRFHLTAFFISSAITAAAWVVCGDFSAAVAPENTFPEHVRALGLRLRTPFEVPALARPEQPYTARPSVRAYEDGQSYHPDWLRPGSLS